MYSGRTCFIEWPELVEELLPADTVRMNDLDVEMIPEFQERLFAFMDNNHSEVLTAIRTTGKLEKDTEEGLKAALNELLVEFK